MRLYGIDKLSKFFLQVLVLRRRYERRSDKAGSGSGANDCPRMFFRPKANIGGGKRIALEILDGFGDRRFDFSGGLLQELGLGRLALRLWLAAGSRARIGRVPLVVAVHI